MLLHAFRAGDPTEDPQHPKIIWPSATDCPNCRTDRMDLFNLDPQIAFVEGQLWNLTMLVQHNIKVYGTDQLVSTIRRGDETLKNIGKLFLLLTPFFLLLSSSAPSICTSPFLSFSLCWSFTQKKGYFTLHCKPNTC